MLCVLFGTWLYINNFLFNFSCKPTSKFLSLYIFFFYCDDNLLYFHSCLKMCYNLWMNNIIIV